MNVFLSYPETRPRRFDRYSPDHANEESFFLAAGLRGICEDLIVLKFIRRLKRKDRDEVVKIRILVALRSGWGDLPRNVTFSTKNFCRYYLEFSQFYSHYMLTRFCRTFTAELNLSTAFMEILNKLEATLSEALRWPEVVTFEEMNQPNPNEIMRAVLFVAHQERVKAKSKASANQCNP